MKVDHSLPFNISTQSVARGMTVSPVPNRYIR